jgi:hypothetical protein
MLTDRDLRLLTFLSEQGVATAEQLTEAFFPNKAAFYVRSAQLSRLGLIESKRIIEFASETPSGVLGYMASLGIARAVLAKKRVYRIAAALRASRSASDDIAAAKFCKHQIHLNTVRTLLERYLPGATVLVDPESRKERARGFWRGTIVPDLVFRCDDREIAVELERTKKGESELLLRFAQYRDSIYSHVLYFCETDRIFETVRKIAQSGFKKIAVGTMISAEKVYVADLGVYMSVRDFLSSKGWGERL